MTHEELKRLAEIKLADCADLNQAPFGADAAEASAFLQGKATALQWMLEMLPALERSSRGCSADLNSVGTAFERKWQ